MKLARLGLFAVFVLSCRTAAKPAGSEGPPPAVTPSARTEVTADATAPLSTTDVAHVGDGDGLVVILSKTQLIAGERSILSLPKRAQLVLAGVDAKYKKEPGSFLIVPLSDAAREYRDQEKARGGRSSLEAMVIADPTTPYRALFEVLFTLGQAEFSKFHMMILRHQASGAVPDSTRAAPSGAIVGPHDGTVAAMGAHPIVLNLFVSIASGGIEFRTTRGRIGDGCKQGAPGVAVPTRGATYDFDAVHRCAQQIKAIAPTEAHVTLTALPATDYETLLSTMDALRGEGDERLFPDVSLGVLSRPGDPPAGQ